MSHQGVGFGVGAAVRNAGPIFSFDGETQRFGVGSALLVEDTSGKGHQSRVLDGTDSLAAMVQLGP